MTTYTHRELYRAGHAVERLRGQNLGLARETAEVRVAETFRPGRRETVRQRALYWLGRAAEARREAAATRTGTFYGVGAQATETFQHLARARRLRLEGREW